MTKTRKQGTNAATEPCGGGDPYPVVVGAVDVPGHAEVSDLHQQVGPDQAVAGGQVPVHEVLGGQVDHARGDLAGDVQHLGEPQLAFRLARLPVHEDHGVWPVGPAGVGGEARGGENSGGFWNAPQQCMPSPLSADLWPTSVYNKMYCVRVDVGETLIQVPHEDDSRGAPGVREQPYSSRLLHSYLGLPRS